jgi:hypothetical protein
VAQSPRRSRRLQGLPPELPELSSTEENREHPSNSPSLPVSNVETPLVTETASVPPSILNPGSDTPYEFPDLISFTEPLLETYLFPSEGPTQVSQVQSIVNQLLDSHPESLFEVYSENSLPLNEEQGSVPTPWRVESFNSEVTSSSHPTFHTSHSHISRDSEFPSSENISFTTSSVGDTYPLETSALPFLFSEYQPVEPRPDLVRRPFHFHYNQPLSYEDPFVLLQLPGPTSEPWQNTPEYQQILRDGRSHTMDPFPSLMDSDPDLPNDLSMGEGPTVPLLHSDHWVPFSQRESPQPSLFHYQPIPTQDVTSGHHTIRPVAGLHDHIQRPEVFLPPPPNPGEASTSNPTGGQYISRGTSPTRPTHQNSLHVGTIPLAVNRPLLPYSQSDHNREKIPHNRFTETYPPKDINL